MAIYHLSAKLISRSNGQSVIAAAAYRSGEQLKDYKSGETKQYERRKARVACTRVYTPADAPPWSRDREALWNKVEEVETRKNSVLAREYELALPIELTDLQRIRLVEDFVRETFLRNGLIADVAFHDPDRDADPRNFHVHILVPERQISAAGFASLKYRNLQKKKFLYDTRAKWARLCNRHLARYGHLASVDHRSLKDQGVDRVPDVHLGYIAAEIERRGSRSIRGDQRRRIRQYNAAKAASWADALTKSAIALAEARHAANELATEYQLEENFELATDIWGKPLGPR